MSESPKKIYLGPDLGYSFDRGWHDKDCWGEFHDEGDPLPVMYIRADIVEGLAEQLKTSMNIIIHLTHGKKKFPYKGTITEANALEILAAYEKATTS